MNEKVSKTFAPQEQESCCDDTSCRAPKTPYLREIPKIALTIPVPATVVENSKNAAAALKS